MIICVPNECSNDAPPIRRTGRTRFLRRTEEIQEKVAKLGITPQSQVPDRSRESCEEGPRPHLGRFVPEERWLIPLIPVRQRRCRIAFGALWDNDRGQLGILSGGRKPPTKKQSGHCFPVADRRRWGKRIEQRQKHEPPKRATTQAAEATRQ
jgi:hypothetical protein